MGPFHIHPDHRQITGQQDRYEDSARRSGEVAMARVLLADDDATQLELCARLIEAGGHQVTPAFCPSEVLRQVSSADIVIMDLRFRNADGRSEESRVGKECRS